MKNENIENNEEEEAEELYLTGSYLDWQRILLLRVMKQTCQYLLTHLSQDEAKLFEIYQRYDENHDGVVSGDEVEGLEAECEQFVSECGGTVDPERSLVDQDGQVTFLNMLKWYNGVTHSVASTLGSLFSLAVDRTAHNAEARFDHLSLRSLRVNLMGHRSVLEQVREFALEQKLNRLLALELEQNLKNLGREYHDLVVGELDDDENAMWAAFLNVDTSGDLLLDAHELTNLLGRILPNESASELERRKAQFHMLKSGDLTFVQVLQWWKCQQAVDQGRQLRSSVRSLAFDGRMDAFFTGSYPGERTWRAAIERGKISLSRLRDALVRVVREIRYYKMEIDLRRIELDCAEEV